VAIPSDKPDDREPLLQRASEGDAVAMDRLLERYLPDLERYVRRHAGPLIGPRESAADLVQSACREVLQHAERFRYDGEEGFRRWLFATALRKIQDRHRFHRAERRDIRREQRSPQTPPEAKSDLSRAFFRTLATPSGDAAMREEIERIGRIFASLPDRYREVITLAQIEKLPSSEVGRRMGLTDANARMLLSRALARLARLLRESQGT